MAAVCGIDDDLLPTAALAVALPIVEETQRLHGLEDAMEECSRKKRDISMYMWLGAGAGR